MVVCKFFQQGNCRFGDGCKFEHPGGNRGYNSTPNANANANSNRFAPLSGQGQGQTQGGRGRSGALSGGASQSEAFNITGAGIRQDLSSISGGDPPGDRPIWPLSCYAPGNKPPRQLIEGNLEQSPEEMRLKFYIARAAGSEQEYANHERDLLTQVEQKIQTILNDVEGAKKYVVDGQYEHPNRQDIENKPTGPWTKSQTIGGFGQPSGQPSAFGAPSAPSTGAGFGQPSSLGGSTAFGQPLKPGFGQAAQPGGGGGGFGQPSALGGGGGFGQTSNLGANPSAFGAQSQPGFGQSGFSAAKPSAFGAPTAAAGAPAFGSSTAFGVGANKPSPFSNVQPAQSGGTAFGQPSAFGAASKPSPFAAAAQQSSGFTGTTANPSPFGQKPAFGQSGFGSSSGGAFGGAFGQPSNPPTSGFGAPSQTATPGAFGAPSQPGASAGLGASSQQAAPNTFGAPAQPTAGFGAPSQPAAIGTLGAPPQSAVGTFGAPSQSATGFGAASRPAATGGLGAPTQPTATGFGAPSQPAPSGFGAPSQPAASGFGSQPLVSGFGAPSQPATSGGFGSTSQQSSAPNAAAADLPLPSHWHGMQVVPDENDPKVGYYMKHTPTTNRPDYQKRERIWFPHGHYGKENEDAEPAKEVLESNLGRQLKELYDFVKTNGAFKDGIVPEIPPKREWVGWDF